MLKVKYYLRFDYGIHKKDVETNEKDFYEVIADLNKEFRIRQINNDDYPSFTTTYELENYYGDWETIGYNRYE